MSSGNGASDWILWGLLATGVGFVGISLPRFLKPRPMQGEAAEETHEDALVIGDTPLHPDMQVRVMPIREPRKEALPFAREGYLESVGRRAICVHLEPPKDHYKENLFPVGSTVLVEVTGKDALYRFEAPVQDNQLLSTNLPERLLTLARPRWLHRQQRRRHPRTPLQTPLCLHSLEGEAYLLPVHGTMEDLSIGGFSAQVGGVLGVETLNKLMSRLEKGTCIRVRLDLPPFTAPVIARVQACERITVRGGLSLRVRCAFLSLNLHEEEALARSLAHAQKTGGDFSNPFLRPTAN